MSGPDTSRRLLRRFRPHAPRLALAVLLIGVQASVPAALVLLLEGVLDAGLAAGDHRVLLWAPLALVGLYVVGGAADLARATLTRRVAWAVVADLRRELAAALLRQDLPFHLHQRPAALAAALTGEVEDVQYAVSAVVSAVQRPLTVLGLLLSAGRLAPGLTLTAAVVLPLLLLPTRALHRRLRAAAADRNAARAELAGVATELVAGARTLQELGAEAQAQERFGAAAAALDAAERRAHLARMLPGPVVELAAAAGIAALIAVGGRQVLAGALSPGGLVAFLVALGLALKPLKGLVEVGSLMSRATAGAGRAFALIDRIPALPAEGEAACPPRFVVEATGLRFAWGEREVLRGVDLRLEPGRVVGLVGASGAGKSTLLRALLGHIQPTAGALHVNGAPLSSLRRAAWRARVAAVGPDDLLLDATPEENLRLGAPGAPRDALRAAAAAAGALELLDGGLWGQPIGHEGRRLSAGQRQRLVLARALLRDPGLLLLDEPTSHLDAAAEAALLGVIAALGRDRAVLHVSHRLRALVDCDEILVLHEGEVVERGSHAALRAAGGIYAALWAEGEGDAGPR